MGIAASDSFRLFDSNAQVDTPISEVRSSSREIQKSIKDLQNLFQNMISF